MYKLLLSLSCLVISLGFLGCETLENPDLETLSNIEEAWNKYKNPDPSDLTYNRTWTVLELGSRLLLENDDG